MSSLASVTQVEVVNYIGQPINALSLGLPGICFYSILVQVVI
jgi:hypothetical protein